MSYLIQPLDMIQAPNFFAMLNTFSITQPNANTIWFQLQISDSLGERRFVPAAGSTLTVEFMRANLFERNNRQPVQAPQSVIKSAVAHADDKSLFSVALTSQDVQAIRSGTVKVNLTMSGTTTSWNQNYLVEKKIAGPGC